MHYPVSSRSIARVVARGVASSGLLLLALVPAHPVRAQTTSLSYEAKQNRYQSRITVANFGTDSVPAGYSLALVFDHAALVRAGRAQASGADFRIVYVKDGVAKEIKRALDLSSSWNTATTKVWFPAQATIAAGGGRDGAYYAVFGNPRIDAPSYDPHIVPQRDPGVQLLLLKSANANLRANHFIFSDSTDGWTASPGLYDSAFAADTAITMVNYPAYFTPAQVLNIAEKFIAARNAAGEFPICLLKSGSPDTYYSAWDLLHHHATGDGAFYVPQLESLYYRKTGDISPFLRDAAAIRTALSTIPLNPKTGLVQVVAGDEWVPWGFQDMVRKTGDDLMGSLLYDEAARETAVLDRAAKRWKDAGFFSARINRIRKSLPELWDAKDGMFYAATAQNRQIDIEGSAYAVYIGAASSSQGAAISAYLSRNYDKLTMSGYVRESPQDWTSCYYIAGNHSCFGPGQYDNGAWSVADAWIAYALAKTSPALAEKLITGFAISADPSQEYWSWGATKPPYSGQKLNLESPSTALSYANENPSLSSTTVEKFRTMDYSGVFSYWDDFSSAKPEWSASSGDWKVYRGVLRQVLGEQSAEEHSSKFTHPIAFADNVLVQADLRVNSNFDWNANFRDQATAGICLDNLEAEGDASNRGDCSVLMTSSPLSAAITRDQTAQGGSMNFPWTTSTWYRMAIARNGATLRSKVWAVGSAEPKAWQQVSRKSGNFTPASSAATLALMSAFSTDDFDNLLVRQFLSVEPVATFGRVTTLRISESLSLGGMTQSLHSQSASVSGTP